MKSDKKTYVTISKTKTMGKHKWKDDVFTIKMTQTYMQEYDMGHYHWVVEDANGNVIGASGSVCGVPQGKINDETLDYALNSFYRDWSFSRKVEEKG